MIRLTRREALASAAGAAALAHPVLAQTGRPAMTDLILVNAKVTTLDRENPVAEAVAIRDGKFLAVGSQAEVRAAAEGATVSDAGGRLSFDVADKPLSGMIETAAHDHDHDHDH